MGRSKVWWYRIASREEYVYIRLPVNVGSVVEEVTRASEEETADDIFRFVAVPTGRIKVGPRPIPNVRMDFMLFAYRPLLLLDMLKTNVPGSAG